MAPKFRHNGDWPGLSFLGRKFAEKIICRRSDARVFSLFEVDLTKEMPYHETLTRFWMNTVEEFRKKNPEFDVETINRLIETRDKHYPEKFYSKEVLFSDKARREYVTPDLV